MHPLNADSGGSTAAGPVDVGAASDAGVTQREFLKSLVTDAMEDFRDDFHRDIQGLHVAMLRQFHNFEVRWSLFSPPLLYSTWQPSPFSSVLQDFSSHVELDGIDLFKAQKRLPPGIAWM